MSAPSDETLLAGIAAVAAEHLDHHDPITPQTSLVSAMSLDSIRMLTLVVELENHFKVMLEEGDEQGIETVGDLMGVLRARMQEQAGA
ncbi:MAG: acyl carrier protein [Myxococcota bacterium]|nr:acyl carrier protein [Myxococcota bacterium]